MMRLLVKQYFLFFFKLPMKQTNKFIRQEENRNKKPFENIKQLFMQEIHANKHFKTTVILCKKKTTSTFIDGYYFFEINYEKNVSPVLSIDENVKEVRRLCLNEIDKQGKSKNIIDVEQVWKEDCLMIGARLRTYVSYLFGMMKTMLLLMILVLVEEDDKHKLNVRVVHRLIHEVDLVFHLHHQSFEMNNHH